MMREEFKKYLSKRMKWFFYLGIFFILGGIILLVQGKYLSSVSSLAFTLLMFLNYYLIKKVLDAYQ